MIKKRKVNKVKEYSKELHPEKITKQVDSLYNYKNINLIKIKINKIMYNILKLIYINL